MTDLEIENSAELAAVTIRYYANHFSRTISGADYDFVVLIDGNGLSRRLVYEVVQYRLRKLGNINDNVSDGDALAEDKISTTGIQSTL